MVIDLGAIPGVVAVLGIPFWKRMRKTVTEPRIGHVQLNSSRLARLRRGHLVLKAIVLLALLGVYAIVLFDPSWRGQLGSLNPMPLGVVFGVLVVLGEFFFEVNRLFVYAGIIE